MDTTDAAGPTGSRSPQHGERSRHEFLDHDGVLAFAHRGGTEAAPENSLAAFTAAVDLGYRYLETDVHLTRDGVVVAAHDEHLDRVTDASGAIAEMTWQEVSSARIGGTEPVPTLEELLEAFPGVRFNIDAKSDAVVDPLLEILVGHDALDRACVGAFSQERLRRVRARMGDALCTSAGPREVSAMVARSRLRRGPGASPPPFGCLQVPVAHRGVTVVSRALVELAHSRGVQVHVWTIDDPAEMHRLLDLGVDGIMTDRPGVLRSVLDERGSWSGTGAESRHRDARQA